MQNRWWIYQRERFPIFSHGALIAAFSFSAVGFSSLLRGDVALPSPAAMLVAFVTSFIFFLQLRIADEFKDYEEDCKFRPYRPVPRGLIQLPELGLVFAVGALLQLGLALWLKPAMAFILLTVWVYLAFMSKEFFARDWLKARPFTYMWSHMLIMPLIDFYATACDWFVANAPLPTGLYWFLIVSFFNGMVIEIGRKLRAPEDEEPGVETYTFLWGRTKAVLAWLAALCATAICAFIAAMKIQFLLPVTAILVALLITAAFLSWRFLSNPLSRHAKRFEMVSGVWTLSMYLSLGAAPLLLRVWS